MALAFSCNLKKYFYISFSFYTREVVHDRPKTHKENKITPDYSLYISGRFENRNNGNAGEPSGNWRLGPSTGDASLGSDGITPEKF